MIFQFNNLLSSHNGCIWDVNSDDDHHFNFSGESNVGSCLNPAVSDIFNYTNSLLFKKRDFVNISNKFQKVVVVSKIIPNLIKTKRYFFFIRRFFSKISFNKTAKQRTPIFLTYLVLYFFLTHDLYFFCKKLTSFLQKTERRYQFKVVRHFKLFNKFTRLGILDYFGVSGVYFRISGKFGGVGGSKKLRKTVVWGRPGFSDRSLKLQRSINTVWSFTGTTTWSIYASFL